MRIKKILNNNVVVAESLHEKECIIVGKGVGFNKQIGEIIDREKTEKIFQLENKGLTQKLSSIIQDIPLEYIRVCDEIINMAKNELPGDIQESIYLSLIDHISFAIERHLKGIDLKSTFIFDMKRFYSEEYQVGLKALDIIKKRLNIEFSEDEAVFIAFHFVTANSSVKDYDVQNSLIFINDVLEIIQSHFSIKFDENSISYNRFLTHLKFFSLRIFSEDSPKLMLDEEAHLFFTLQKEMVSEADCVEKITLYVKKNYDKEVTSNEKLYLLIHIHALLNK